MIDLENTKFNSNDAYTYNNIENIKKNLNASSWNDNIEKLMKIWGEKAAGLRFLHNDTSNKWKKFSDNLTLFNIIITSIASTISLIATSVTDEDTKNKLLFSVSGISLTSTLFQSIKKFYNPEEKAADHNTIAKQFGSFYRIMTLQLSMTREDRESANVLSTWALKEYERLQQEAPNIEKSSIELFKSKFDKEKQHFPDIVENIFSITIYNDNYKTNQAYLKLDTKSDIKLDTKSNIESNIESNIKPDIKSNIESNIKPDIKSNIESNIESDIKSNIESNIESDIKPDIESNNELNI